MSRPLRIVVGKIGLDGHDRGAKVISAGLRDAGYEVIYTGIRQTPQNVVSIALQEDADVIAVSILSGTHNTLCKKLMDLLKEQGGEDILCLAGGIISQQDVKYLEGIGIAGVFTPGTSIQEIVDFIEKETESQQDSYSI